MNWPLLLELGLAFTVVFFLLIYDVKFAVRAAAQRFEAEFGIPYCEESFAPLSDDNRSRWSAIYAAEFEPRIRKREVIFACFNYPSIIVLSAILRRNTMTLTAMFFVTGTTYIAACYLFLNR